MESIKHFLCYSKYGSTSSYIADNDESNNKDSVILGTGMDNGSDLEDLIFSKQFIPLSGIAELKKGIYLASVELERDDLCIDDDNLYCTFDHFKTFGVFGEDKGIIVPFYYSKIVFDADCRVFYCYKLQSKKTISLNRYQIEHVIHKRSIDGQLIIENEGKEIFISKEYDDFRSFSDGMCAVHRGEFLLGHNEGWGFVDNTGKEVIPCNMLSSKVSDFQNGFAIEYEAVFGGNPVRYFNRKGETIFQKKMYKAAPFSDGFALVELSSDTHSIGWNYVQENGTLLLSSNVESATVFRDGRAEIKIDRESKSKHIINRKGQFLFHENNEEIWLNIDINLIRDYRDFHDGFCVICDKKDQYGLINRDGTIVMDFCFSSFSDYENGVAKVTYKRRGNDSFTWSNGHVYCDFKPRYYEMEINLNQEIIIQSSHGIVALDRKYRCAYALSNTLVAVLCNDRFGVVNQFGHEVLPCKYATITVFNDRLKTYDYCDDSIDYDMSGNPIFPSEINDICLHNQYETASILTPGVYIARKERKWALLDKGGNPITSFVFDKIRTVYKDNKYTKGSIFEVEVRKYGRPHYGYISSDGQQLLDSNYRNILPEDNCWKSKADFDDYRYITDGGFECPHNRFTHLGISSSEWGVFSFKQRRIIIDGYNCIYRDDECFVAGRDGEFLTWCDDIHEYSGVYDLYTIDGELLIGGFSELSIFGCWLILTYDIGWWTNDNGYPKKIVLDSTRWLVLDSNFQLLSSRLMGESSSIKKGTVIDVKKTSGEKGTEVHTYSFPLKFFFEESPQNRGSFLSVIFNGLYYFICASDERVSQGYSRIEPFDDSFYYTIIECGDKQTLGIFDTASFSEIVEGCSVITQPIDGFVFIICELETGDMRVSLLNLESNESITVIEKVDKTTLNNYLNASKLHILNMPNHDSCYRIEVLDATIFDNAIAANIFSKSDSDIEKSEYWRSVDPELSYIPIPETSESEEDDGINQMIEDESMSAYDNPYYNDGMDLDQQSEDFWNEF